MGLTIALPQSGLGLDGCCPPVDAIGSSLAGLCVNQAGFRGTPWNSRSRQARAVLRVLGRG